MRIGVNLLLVISCAMGNTVANGASDVWELRDRSLTIPTETLLPFHLEKNWTFEVSVRIRQPSRLTSNVRLRATLDLVKADNPVQALKLPAEGELDGRSRDAFGIYRSPSARVSKVLHALDADVGFVYRASVSGSYRLTIVPEENELDLFANAPGARWREDGHAPQFRPVPSRVEWPTGCTADVNVSFRTIDTSGQHESGFYIEAEPNDTPEQAQRLHKLDDTDGQTICIIGSGDDAEYFDNGHYGRSGDDWFRIEFDGPAPRLLTACLSIPDQQVAARLRVYQIPRDRLKETDGEPILGDLLPLSEYEEGKNLNEKAHQQIETHRTAINRTLHSGGIYFLRVEANSPGYDLELRVVKPAPYADPRRAIRHALYDHIAQVDAWLTNRPRGASVDRRIRDSGNLLGTNCMSCHTQSGVWGPAVPFAQGYRPENVQAWRHLINSCYQSMRPTNELKDAANNTSLKPLDLGDGPAGTRVAGHAVVALERFMPPRKLQSFQAIRAANFVLQSGDPGGINAAGPGANVGQGVVFNYAGEIVASAWKNTGRTDYFRSMEDKARKMLDVEPKFTDDLGHRVEHFLRYFPSDYIEASEKLANGNAEEIQKARDLQQRINSQVKTDLARLRAIQNDDGSWGFNPGQQVDGKWTVTGNNAEPSPTSLALIAFEAAGIPAADPTVERGIRALLRIQLPTGLWNKSSATGFVSTSYALHALSRYFPARPDQSSKDQFDASAQKSFLQTIARVRRMAVAQDRQHVTGLAAAAEHTSPLVRYWAMIGLSYLHSEDGLSVLIHGLGDPWKMVREAAHWGLRQTLIDDKGWDETFKALESSDDYVREAAMRALVMKVDGVLPEATVDWVRLARALDFGLNHDPHPGVRAWSTRAAWQWWVWNPPIREAINRSWQNLLVRDEDNLHVENAMRYQTHALFIANGHVANATDDHKYPQLKDLFSGLRELLAKSASFNPDMERQLAGRLVAVAATFYKTRGGDGGPGQMGYSTDGAADLFSDAALSQLRYIETLPEYGPRELLTKVTLEGAANIPEQFLQEKLVDYSLNGPEKLRRLAAESISDPRLVKFPAVDEQLEPMYRQLVNGAYDPPRRKDLSDPILKMYGGVHWLLPDTVEQRLGILKYVLPELTAWKTVGQIDEITDAVEKQRVERETDAAWYLADGLGKAIAKNPDLQFEQLAESLPDSFTNAAEARLWMRSVDWLLSFKKQLPEVHINANQLPPIDPFERLRTRALSLFLTQLAADAHPDNRREAVELANKTALRRNPEVLTALESLVEYEKDDSIVKNARKVISQNRGTFVKDLAAAVKVDEFQPFPIGNDGTVTLPEDFVQDVTYFRDYVIPEMTKVLRGDERSCMICHGEPGRVPSMELHAPDRVGFLPVDKLLKNYHILRKRVNLNEVANSRLLRKPLNVQTAEEEGHQGGRRYQPMDAGYQILKKWAYNQVDVQAKYFASNSNVK